MGERFVTRVVVRPVVEVIHRHAFQQRDGLTANLVGGAVVDIQLAGTTSNVDAAATHRRLIAVVDALVPVPDKEQVVRAGLDQRPEQTQRLGAKILGFIDDNGGVRVMPCPSSMSCAASR